MSASPSGQGGAVLLSPVPAEQFRHFMRHWPTGVAIVTTPGVEGPVGCTVNAMMSLSMEPPLLVVSLSLGSRTLQAIGRAGIFGASVLGWDQHELCRRFADCPPEGRFHGLRLREEHGVPLIADTAAQAVCTVRTSIPCADHILVVGAPIWQSTDPDLAPLLLYRGSHHRLTG